MSVNLKQVYNAIHDLGVNTIKDVVTQQSKDISKLQIIK